MNVTYRIDKDILYIALEGRIDASNAALAEEKIFAIKNSNQDKHTVIDADNLEYISSARVGGESDCPEVVYFYFADALVDDGYIV